MGGFQNFAISFTIISILAGCLTSYYIGFSQGGPVAITWGWLIVGVACTFVAMAMGEIASTYPTAGGLYFWASKLGGPGWGWFTGWFNLIGQIAVTAAIGFGCGDLHDLAVQPVVELPELIRLDLLPLRDHHALRRPDQHVQGLDHCRAQYVLGLVAHDRRARARRDHDHRPGSSPVVPLRLRADDQQHRTGRNDDARLHLRLRLPHRPAPRRSTRSRATTRRRT